jgi:hypothetical protein
LKREVREWRDYKIEKKKCFHKTQRPEFYDQKAGNIYFET